MGRSGLVWYNNRMFKDTKAFSSYSTDDLSKAKTFYGETLGLTVEEFVEMGILNVHFANGGELMIYPKDNHIPATYTVLNLPVPNIDEAVSELISKGITFEQYDSEYLKTDEKGISRGEGQSMAWFKDPAGNILSVIQIEEETS